MNYDYNILYIIMRITRFAIGFSGKDFCMIFLKDTGRLREDDIPLVV